MARFLIASLPITGHVLPALPLARALVARGHEVRWYTGQKFRARVEATGAHFAPFRAAYDFDDGDLDAAFPARSAATGLNRAKFDFINLFMKSIAAHYHDLRAILADFPADVLLADSAVWAASCVTEKGGPPHALCVQTCLGIVSRDTGPYGMGLPPSSSPLGRLRNRALRILTSDLLFRDVSAELTRQRASLGLGPQRFDGVPLSPYLLLAATVPGFEYPLSDLPPQVHFIGALIDTPPIDAALPAWWDEVAARQRPVVLVTQGTFETDPGQLIAPTLAGLAREDLLVVVAGVRSAEALGPGGLPENARIAPFIPFGLAMPHVDLFVTNGGFGGVHHALAHGVPLVLGGATEDKPEVANRVARAGAGINLKTARPPAAQVRDAARAALRTPGYRQAARRLQAELAQHAAPAEAALLLERLATTQRPVLAHTGVGHRAATGAREQVR